MQKEIEVIVRKKSKFSLTYLIDGFIEILVILSHTKHLETYFTSFQERAKKW